jgi:hypothetical protein
LTPIDSGVRNREGENVGGFGRSAEPLKLAYFCKPAARNITFDPSSRADGVYGRGGGPLDLELEGQFSSEGYTKIYLSRLLFIDSRFKYDFKP